MHQVLYNSSPYPYLNFFKLIAQNSKWLDIITFKTFKALVCSSKLLKVSQFEGFWLEATVAHIIAASLCVCEFIGWMAAAKFPSNMGFNVCNHDMSYWILAWVGLASNLLLCLYRVRASVRVIENIEFQNTSAKSILKRAEAGLILKKEMC